MLEYGQILLWLRYDNEWEQEGKGMRSSLNHVRSCRSQWGEVSFGRMWCHWCIWAEEQHGVALPFKGFLYCKAGWKGKRETKPVIAIIHQRGDSGPIQGSNHWHGEPWWPSSRYVEVEPRGIADRLTRQGEGEARLRDDCKFKTRVELPFLISLIPQYHSLG